MYLCNILEEEVLNHEKTTTISISYFNDLLTQKLKDKYQTAVNNTKESLQICGDIYEDLTKKEFTKDMSKQAEDKAKQFSNECKSCDNEREKLEPTLDDNHPIITNITTLLAKIRTKVPLSRMNDTDIIYKFIRMERKSSPMSRADINQNTETAATILAAKIIPKFIPDNMTHNQFNKHLLNRQKKLMANVLGNEKSQLPQAISSNTEKTYTNALSFLDQLLKSRSNKSSLEI